MDLEKLQIELGESEDLSPHSPSKALISLS